MLTIIQASIVSLVRSQIKLLHPTLKTLVQRFGSGMR
jgi:hypothetical protein